MTGGRQEMLNPQLENAKKPRAAGENWLRILFIISEAWRAPPLALPIR
jgi:hypothetical protein